MKLQYCSDLHLEFPDNEKYLKANPLQPKGDILLLAGDIVPFVAIGNHKDFFNRYIRLDRPSAFIDNIFQIWVISILRMLLPFSFVL